MQDCLQATAQLGNMPCLSELVLQAGPLKLKGRESDESEAYVKATLLEKLLVSLKEHCAAHVSLQSLQITAMDDEIILSRSRPPKP